MPVRAGIKGAREYINYPKQGEAIKVCDVSNDTIRLAQGLRERLQEMTAVSQALSTSLTEDEKAANYLAILDRAICVQLRLVRQLELSHKLYTENSEVRAFMAPTDLVEVGRDVMEKANALTWPLLEIKAEFSSSLSALPAQADRAELEEMLLFFIANSVRAIGRKGTIRLGLEQQGEQAVFTVTDTGGGLDPEVLEDLFDTNAEAETRARGLRLAQQIAGLHGGTMVAGNSKSGGARLAVSIPIKDWVGGYLQSPPIPVDNTGGWDPALVALADWLPLEAFLPDGGET